MYVNAGIYTRTKVLFDLSGSGFCGDNKINWAPKPNLTNYVKKSNDRTNLGCRFTIIIFCRHMSALLTQAVPAFRHRKVKIIHGILMRMHRKRRIRQRCFFPIYSAELDRLTRNASELFRNREIDFRLLASISSCATAIKERFSRATPPIGPHQYRRGEFAIQHLIFPRMFLT